MLRVVVCWLFVVCRLVFVVCCLLLGDLLRAIVAHCVLLCEVCYCSLCVVVCLSFAVCDCC